MRAPLLCLLLLSPFAQAANLAWDYGSTTGLTGFKLYCGDATGVYAPGPVATVGAVKAATADFPSGLQPYSKFCVVRAYAAMESGNSNEVKVDVPAVAPGAPTNLRLALSLTLDENGKIISARVERMEDVAE